MANRTVSYATSVHGTNPQYLIEKIIRTRIHESKYWKENCTLLNSGLVLEKAVDDLRYVGGVFGGNIKTSPFLCLTLNYKSNHRKKSSIFFWNAIRAKISRLAILVLICLINLSAYIIFWNHLLVWRSSMLS